MDQLTTDATSMADGFIWWGKWSPRVNATTTLLIPKVMPTISNSFSPGLIPNPQHFVVDRCWQSNSQLTSSGCFAKVPCTEQRPGRYSAPVNRESERLLVVDPH